MEQFEANGRQRAARAEEEGDSDDDKEALEFRRLEAGAYTQQRLAVVMVVIAAHSSAVARRVNEKLHQVCVDHMYVVQRDFQQFTICQAGGGIFWLPQRKVRDAQVKRREGRGSGW